MTRDTLHNEKSPAPGPSDTPETSADQPVQQDTGSRGAGEAPVGEKRERADWTSPVRTLKR